MIERSQFGQKPGINKHLEIRLEFAHGNEHACQSACSFRCVNTKSRRISGCLLIPELCPFYHYCLHSRFFSRELTSNLFHCSKQLILFTRRSVVKFSKSSKIVSGKIVQSSKPELQVYMIMNFIIYCFLACLGGNSSKL